MSEHDVLINMLFGGPHATSTCSLWLQGRNGGRGNVQRIPFVFYRCFVVSGRSPRNRHIRHVTVPWDGPQSYVPMSVYLAPKDPFDHKPTVKFLLNNLQLGRWEYSGRNVAGPRNLVRQ